MAGDDGVGAWRAAGIFFRQYVILCGRMPVQLRPSVVAYDLFKQSLRVQDKRQSPHSHPFFVYRDNSAEFEAVAPFNQYLG